MTCLEVAVEMMKKVILRVLPESYEGRWYSSLAYAKRLRVGHAVLRGRCCVKGVDREGLTFSVSENMG